MQPPPQPVIPAKAGTQSAGIPARILAPVKVAAIFMLWGAGGNRHR